jgi:hypothetical protein
MMFWDLGSKPRGDVGLGVCLCCKRGADPVPAGLATLTGLRRWRRGENNSDGNGSEMGMEDGRGTRYLPRYSMILLFPSVLVGWEETTARE